MEKEKLNWRSFGSRDVTVKWNASTPGYYVMDHKGVIRHKWLGNTGPGEKAIDTALEKLIHEVEEGTGSEDAKKPTESHGCGAGAGLGAPRAPRGRLAAVARTEA